jgi:hypothetical protein
MPKISPSITDQISTLSKKELEKLVLKAAAQDKTFHNYLLVNYFDREYAEQDLFDAAKEDLERLFRKSYKGFSQELQLANMLGACLKRINEFSKTCKNKHLEADLILHVLSIPFSLSSNSFTTCFTAYNYKVVLLLKRLISIVKLKLHEDYKIQYAPTINEYLAILHRTSSHLDYVYALTTSI